MSLGSSVGYLDMLVEKINTNIATYNEYVRLTGIVLQLDILPHAIGKRGSQILLKMLVDSCRRVVVETMVCLEELESAFNGCAKENNDFSTTLREINDAIKVLKKKDKNFNCWVKNLTNTFTTK